jgi:urease accessory protein
MNFHPRLSLWSRRWVARLAPLLAVLALSQASVHAHHLPPGFEEIDEFEHGHAMLSGFQHPMKGLDHCLALVAIGAVATLSFRKKAILPASYMGALVAGGWMTLHGMALPQAPMLAASVIAVAAVAIMLRKGGMCWLMTGAAALLGLTQGALHAAWVAIPQTLCSYAVGFAMASLLLMVAGGLAAKMAQRLPGKINIKLA